MGTADSIPERRIPLAVSQQNIYRGVLQDSDAGLYLIGRTYRLAPLPLARLLAAVAATIRNNPVQLCVLDQGEAPYPELVPRLSVDDLVHVVTNSSEPLIHQWDSGILGRPLVRYTVHTDTAGDAALVDVHAHHILLDGGATGLIEADLGRYLSASVIEMADVATGLDRLAQAHLREIDQVHAAHQKLTDVVQREIATGAHLGGQTQSCAAAGSARRGFLRESVQIHGADYDALMALVELQQIPLPVLLTAAAVAVDAARRNSTEALVVHAVDNRFGEPALDVATCLVNSVAQSVRFPAFASVRDLVEAIDRGYVKTARRRWFREELYRRIYLTVHRASATEALALNFLREPCAPALRPFLIGTPETSDIGPIECPTVAAVHDEQRRVLELAIWGGGEPESTPATPRLAGPIAQALRRFAGHWEQPVALSVDNWSQLGPDGACRPVHAGPDLAQNGFPAWFLDPVAQTAAWRQHRGHVDGWIGWLVDSGIEPGAVLVFTDDRTDKTVDLLVACHLAGCGYSVCDTSAELDERARMIAADTGLACPVIDVAGTELPIAPKGVTDRLRSVAADPHLADSLAYVMPTSGSTGVPKLVPISHGALALFCHGHHDACGWTSHDTVMQYAPLTSDISVEEIFGAARCGATLIRSTAVRTGNLEQLGDDVHHHRATVLDLPTALWHLCCEQPEVLAALAASQVRQIVIGGEAVRAQAVQKWLAAVNLSHISLVSSYGPTETTVVATYLPLSGPGAALGSAGPHRVGRPAAPHSVFVAFGEVVIVGNTVSSGYLGQSGTAFGTVTDVNGTPIRAFATADRVRSDHQGFPVFAGRKDAVVKLAGRRVDTAEITRLIAEDPSICDVAVEPDDTRLGIWFSTALTRAGAPDPAAEQRIRAVLLATRVPGFAISAVPEIPRKPGGKVDSGRLPRPRREDSDAAPGQASGLAQLWSRQLNRHLSPDSSLLAEGIGSLDLIRILPATRRYLGRHLSLLDVISADSADRLVEYTDGMGMDETTTAEIEADLASLAPILPHAAPGPTARRSGSVVVLGASGIVGTGFARAVTELRAEGFDSELVLATTSATLPERGPWRALAGIHGVRIEHTSPQQIPELIRASDAATVVNAIGNTNVVVPYRELRPANVEAVAGIVAACAERGAGLVHLSTSVVSPQPATSVVVDPRVAPYPYAASKALAELIVARSAGPLAFALVRLPRVLGEPHQLRASADILVALADACTALGTHPAVHLTEEVTSSRAAAAAILGMVSAPLGRTVTALRATPVEYATFLAGFGTRESDVEQWKQQLDSSDWARGNPRRWAVIDAWLTLGMRLGERSYAQYLAGHASVDLQVEAVTEVWAPDSALAELVTHGCGVEPDGPF
ncbi:AMP-binding protein [Mycolicibacter arupensis]|uniref:Peptide synthase n=1 Tax=Mycolicibacter arupensis TaxID=342002 RepID=A0A0F5MUM5_9MYCO|nr:AMP-binding protein [Mycolicibacter arupensis]KKB98396.1 hypothetical protein WR43_14690 [Mycolicibacter arupensis]OQZ97448.1 hypothetical protein BST15_10630 [Mycolicibacter arupensis]